MLYEVITDRQHQVFTVPLVPMRSQGRCFTRSECRAGYGCRKLHKLYTDERMNQHLEYLQADQGKQW